MSIGVTIKRTLRKFVRGGWVHVIPKRTRVTVTHDWEPETLSDDLEVMRAYAEAGLIPLSDYVKAREAAQLQH